MTPDALPCSLACPRAAPAGLDAASALLSLVLEPGLAQLPHLATGALRLLLAPQLLPTLAAPTDPEQVCHAASARLGSARAGLHASLVPVPPGCVLITR